MTPRENYQQRLRMLDQMAYLICRDVKDVWMDFFYNKVFYYDQVKSIGVAATSNAMFSSFGREVYFYTYPRKDGWVLYLYGEDCLDKVKELVGLIEWGRQHGHCEAVERRVGTLFGYSERAIEKFIQHNRKLNILYA